MVTAANFLSSRQQFSAERGQSGTDLSKLAIIVPAHNEELLVARCVASLRASATTTTQIFVVAHNCSDTTAARARAAGAEVLEYNDPEARGKGFALRHGFEHTLAVDSDAVMVVDADSTVSPNTVAAVQSAFAHGARVIQCRYEMFSTTDRSSTRLAALAFRGFNVVRPRGRERLGLSAGILGNGFAIVRPVLEAIPYDAFSVVEDLEYHLHLVMAGERVRYLEYALVSADFPESRAGESVQRSPLGGWSPPYSAHLGASDIVENLPRTSSLTGTVVRSDRCAAGFWSFPPAPGPRDSFGVGALVCRNFVRNPDRTCACRCLGGSGLYRKSEAAGSRSAVYFAQNSDDSRGVTGGQRQGSMGTNRAG